MAVYDYIKALANERNVDIKSVERACGLGNATIGSWRKSMPAANLLYKVAQYFDVSMEYLLTGNCQDPDNRGHLSPKESESKESEMARFRDNFNRICKEKGTTPTALCKKLGESTSKVSLWNNGSLPKEEMMLRLAQELGCSVEDFFSDNSEHTKDSEDLVQPSKLSEHEKIIVEAFRSADAAGQQNIIFACQLELRKASNKKNGIPG